MTSASDPAAMRPLWTEQYTVRGDGYTFIQSSNAFLTPGRARGKS